jgi:formiminotetrahydrofolate cyclodeaminase
LKKTSECEPGIRAEQIRRSVAEFVAAVAAPTPIPLAGGSVAALAGSLAAALGEMTAGLTQGRARFAAVQPQVTEIHAKLAHCCRLLRDLVEDDSTAFGSVMNAIKLPRETEEQRAFRSEAMESSIRKATETPLRIARAAFEALQYLEVLVGIGNPNAKCDVAVGIQLAYASLKSGQYNILTNIRKMKDTSFAESSRKEVSDLVLRGYKILKRIDRQMMVS